MRLTGEFTEPGEAEATAATQVKVLIVDDEIHIQKVVKRLFLSTDFEIMTASSGEEAMEYIARGNLAVVISDQRMPGMSGSELLKYARKVAPNTVRIMLTGNGDLSTAKEAINQGEVFRFVTKPWENADFLALIRVAVEHHELLTAKERYEAQIRRHNQELQRLNEELEDRVRERTAEVVAKQEEVSELYHELQESFGATIRVLFNILELSDPQVVEHCHRTAERVRTFCDRERWPEELARDLERAAHLHWTGLVNAPDEVFSKTEMQFNAEAQAAWEFHPLLGQQAISHIKELERSGEIIGNYTRRYDDPYFQQEGYGVEFVNACQLLGIASSFERVRTRARRGGRLHTAEVIHDALGELLEKSGEVFDPNLVMAFQQMIAVELEDSMTQERTLCFEELRVGMVLSRPLETASGTAVAPRDIVVTEELLRRWRTMADAIGFHQIYVWSRSGVGSS